MGIITIEKANHLYWLGRYSERVFSTIEIFMEYYDMMIDQDENVFHSFCNRLEIIDNYKDSDDFCERYVFDKQNFDSIISNLSRAYDNAVVLREEISSDTLCYIELPLKVLETRDKEAIALKLQRVKDHLYSFWRSIDDNVDSEACRNIMKCGKYAERLDLYYRFGDQKEDIAKQTAKLENRVHKLQSEYNLEGLTTIHLSQDSAQRWDCLDNIDQLTKLFEVE